MCLVSAKQPALPRAFFSRPKSLRRGFPAPRGAAPGRANPPLPGWRGRLSGRCAPPPRRAPPPGSPASAGGCAPAEKRRARGVTAAAGSPLHLSSAGRALSRVFPTPQPQNTLFFRFLPSSHSVSFLGMCAAKLRGPGSSPLFALAGTVSRGGTKFSRL